MLSKSHKKVIKILVLYIIFILHNIQLIAQNNPTDIDIKIKEYDSKAEEFLEDGKLTEAAKYFSKSAFLLQNNYRYEEAVNYFKRVLNINDSP